MLKKKNQRCVSICLRAYTCYFECISVFTLTIMAKCSAPWVAGWCAHNGQKVERETLDTSRPQWTPSWLRGGKGGTTNLFSNFEKMVATEGGHILGGVISMLREAWGTVVVFNLRQHYPVKIQTVRQEVNSAHSVLHGRVVTEVSECRWNTQRKRLTNEWVQGFLWIFKAWKWARTIFTNISHSAPIFEKKRCNAQQSSVSAEM